MWKVWTPGILWMVSGCSCLCMCVCFCARTCTCTCVGDGGWTTVRGGVVHSKHIMLGGRGMG